MFISVLRVEETVLRQNAVTSRIQEHSRCVSSSASGESSVSNVVSPWHKGVHHEETPRGTKPETVYKQVVGDFQESPVVLGFLLL